MSTYYIGTDVHSNSTELAIEKRGKIVAQTNFVAKLNQKPILTKIIAKTHKG